MVKNQHRGQFGQDVSDEMREIFGGHSTKWPPFCLILVNLSELGGDEAALCQKAGEVLTSTEMAIFQGFRFPHRQREWLAGRLAVKEAVTRLLAKPERAMADIEVGVDHRGKPFWATVAGSMSVQIAISHSGESAVGLASPAPCALDFQEIRSSLARVEARFASADEVRRVQQCHPDKLKALGLLWAGKEALRKYVPLWPLLGFLEAGLDGVVAMGDGFSLSFRPLSGKRELPTALPRVLATLYDENAVAIIFAESGQAEG